MVVIAVVVILVISRCVCVRVRVCVCVCVCVFHVWEAPEKGRIHQRRRSSNSLEFLLESEGNHFLLLLSPPPFLPSVREQLSRGIVYPLAEHKVLDLAHQNERAALR